jgi:phage tail-like protein
MPIGAFNFLVTIDGVVVADFEECHLPALSFDVMEYRQGDDLDVNVHKLPGLLRYGNLVLKRGSARPPTSLALSDWFSSFIKGTGTPTQMTVTLLDAKKNPVIQWSFSNVWPVKYESPALNAKTIAVAIETLEVAVEEMKVSAGGQGT